MKNKKILYIGGAVVLLVLLYYFFVAKKTKPAAVVPETDAKPCGADGMYINDASYAAKVALIVSDMNNTPAWKQQIIDKTRQSWHACGGLSWEECAAIDANWILEQQGFLKVPTGGYCKLMS